MLTQGRIRWDMRNPVEQCGLSANDLNQPATYPTADRLMITLFFETISVEVTNMPYVTVRDILNKVHRELMKREGSVEIIFMAQAHVFFSADNRSPTGRRIDLLAPNYSFAGLSPSHNHTWTLAVRP